MTVYSLEWCAPCHQAKRILDNNKIDYEVKDFDEHRDMLYTLGFQKAPVIEVNGRYTTTAGKAMEYHVQSSVAHA